MKKKWLKRQLWLCLLCAGVLIAFVACGNKGKKSADDKQTDTFGDEDSVTVDVPGLGEVEVEIDNDEGNSTSENTSGGQGGSNTSDGQGGTTDGGQSGTSDSSGNSTSGGNDTSGSQGGTTGGNDTSGSQGGTIGDGQGDTPSEDDLYTPGYH